MKPARIIVLVIALAAGGVAAMLAGRGDQKPAAPAPVAKVEMTDVLVAKTDIGIGQVVTPAELQWQEWPASAAGPRGHRR